MGSRALILETYSYPESALSSVVIPPQGKTVELYSIRMTNRPGAGITCPVGLFQKMSPGNFKVFSYDGTTATEVTDFSSLNVFDTTNGNGIIFQSDDKFGMMGLNVTAAETGAPVYDYQYFDGASFQTLTTMVSPASYGSGENHVIFASPLDWVIGSPAIVGLDPDKYTVLFTSSTAPATAVTVDSVILAKLIDFQFALGHNSGFQVSFDPQDPLRFEAAEGVLPYFGVASANNIVSLTYRLRG